MQEWKTDVNGRRFRVIEQGGIKVREYEKLIQTSGGIVPESQLEEHNRRMKQQTEERLRAAASAEKTLKICPFSDPGGEIRRCSGSRCAFYDETDCAAFRGASEEHTTFGKQCPLLYRQPCRRDCSFFCDGGCIVLK